MYFAQVRLSFACSFFSSPVLILKCEIILDFKLSSNLIILPEIFLLVFNFSLNCFTIFTVPLC
jgi:hypothetical protein